MILFLVEYFFFVFPVVRLYCSVFCTCGVEKAMIAIAKCMFFIPRKKNMPRHPHVVGKTGVIFAIDMQSILRGDIPNQQH